MNKNYVCIDFESSLKPQEMLSRLRDTFPEAKWRGSDTDTQGPSLSSIPEDGPRLQIFFDGKKNNLCMSFGSVHLKDSDLESYKAEFLGYVRQEVLPLITVSSWDAGGKSPVPPPAFRVEWLSGRREKSRAI